MNPEEGELRPQLLDRFGLTVEIAAPRDPELRAEVVRRRMAFDADPDGFADAYAGRRAGAAAADRRPPAALLPTVRLSDDQLITIAEICAAFEVDGHAGRHRHRPRRRRPRGLARPVRRSSTADIRAAARLALPHRRRRNPFDAPGLDEDLLDQLLAEEHEPGARPDPPPTGDPTPDGPLRRLRPPTCQRLRRLSASSDELRARDKLGAGERTQTIAPAGATYRTRLFTAAGVGRGEAGRRSRAITATGRTVGAIPPAGRARPAAPAGHHPGRGAAAGTPRPGRHGPLRLARDDLRLAVTEGRESNLVLLVVDASGSMAARRRMEAVKAAALSLLLDAYQRRDKVGLITFRGAEATLALPPTSSIDVAARRLRELPSGGRTPLAEGLLCAAETLRLEADPRPAAPAAAGPGHRRPGHLTAPTRWPAPARSADQLRPTGVASVVIDCETGRFTPRPGRGAERAPRRRSTCRSARSPPTRC